MKHTGFVILSLEILSVNHILVKNPARIEDCRWDEWDCPNGYLLEQNCSFMKTSEKWETTARCYEVPYYLRKTT